MVASTETTGLLINRGDGGRAALDESIPFVEKEHFYLPRSDRVGEPGYFDGSSIDEAGEVFKVSKITGRRDRKDGKACPAREIGW